MHMPRSASFPLLLFLFPHFPSGSYNQWRQFYSSRKVEEANSQCPKFFAGRSVTMMGFLLFSSFVFICPCLPSCKSGWLTTFYFLPRATYSDGKIKAPPKPCAGNQGTQITVGFCVRSLLFLFCCPCTSYIVRYITVSSLKLQFVRWT